MEGDKIGGEEECAMNGEKMWNFSGNI